jgi:DNA invertase Pin-like site-specific DNA recombinase
MSPTNDVGKVVGYVRVSTDEQADSGAGLSAQRTSIEAECQRRGWELVDVVEDAGVSGSIRFENRPGGRRVMDMLQARKAGGLVVAKLDRLSRSSLDAIHLVQDFSRRRLALTLMDVGIDTSTPHGEAMASVMAVFAQLERRMIGQRTRDALAAKKAAGVQLGRPVEIDPETELAIVELRRGGSTLEAITDQLNANRVPTARGGQWAIRTVRRVLDRHRDQLPAIKRGRQPKVAGQVRLLLSNRP